MWIISEYVDSVVFVEALWATGSAEAPATRIEAEPVSDLKWSFNTGNGSDASPAADAGALCPALLPIKPLPRALSSGMNHTCCGKGRPRWHV